MKNQFVYRALVKVSNAIRGIISRGNDKLRIGLYNCRVYDQLLWSEDAISVKTLGIGLLNAIVIMVKHVQSVPHWNMKLEIAQALLNLNA